MILSPLSGGVLDAGSMENWEDHLSGATSGSVVMADILGDIVEAPLGEELDCFVL